MDGMAIIENEYDFNPRSYKRSDLQDSHRALSIRYFNPRSYKRSDSINVVDVLPPMISIHAPTRGATTMTFSGFVIVEIFQSTLLQEERQKPIWMILRARRFQSTLLQEERLQISAPLLAF